MELTLRTRRVKLIAAVAVMLFTGIIYAWSITKTPFMIISDGVVENNVQLGLNYTLTIVFFCLGGFAAGMISKHISAALRLVLSAFLIFASFFNSSLLMVTLPYTENYFLLYMAYGMLGGLGIGIAYVTVISSVNAWYPDKRGFSSGVMMMGFGVSLLLVGSLVDLLGKSESVGWQSTYVIIAFTLGIILLLAALVIKPPPRDAVLPPAMTSKKSKTDEENTAAEGSPANKAAPANIIREYTALEMIKRPSFIFTFIYLAILASSGSAAIGFAKDIVLDVGASETLAVITVGLLGVSNGLGRIVCGLLFDNIGIKQTQYISSAVGILAPLTVVMALAANSAILGVLGVCLCGFSYGFAPTTSSVLTSEFFGLRNFPLNFSIMTLILVPAPFAAMLAGNLKASTGGFMLAFIILTALTVVGFFVNLAIRKPE